MMIFLKKKYKLFGFLLLGVIVSAYLMFEICQGCIFPLKAKSNLTSPRSVIRRKSFDSAETGFELSDQPRGSIVRPSKLFNPMLSKVIELSESQLSMMTDQTRRMSYQSQGTLLSKNESQTSLKSPLSY